MLAPRVPLISPPSYSMNWIGGNAAWDFSSYNWRYRSITGPITRYPANSLGNTVVNLNNNNGTLTIASNTAVYVNKFNAIASDTIAANSGGSIVMDGYRPTFTTTTNPTTIFTSSISCVNQLLISGNAAAGWTLNAANTFTNGILNTGGLLSTNNATGIGAGTLTFAAPLGGACLRITANVTLANNITFTGNNLGVATRAQIESNGNNVNCTVSGTITVNSGTLSNGGVFGANGTNAILNVTGAVNGVCNVGGGTQQRIGTVIYSGGGSMTGIFVINSSATNICTVGANNGFPTGLLPDIGGASAFDLAGFNQSLAGVQNSGSIGNSSTASNSVLTLTATCSYSGVMKDVLASGNKTTGLTVTAGTITFSGVNTYTGATTVSGGTLSVTGTIASGSAVSVNGGMLQGSGTVGAVTVSNTTGSVLQPGTGAATTTTLNTGAVTFNGATAAYNITTNGTTLFSKISCTGTITLGGVTVNLLGTLNAGTYNIAVATVAVTGTAVVGTNNTGRTVTSLTAVGANLVLILG